MQDWKNHFPVAISPCIISNLLYQDKNTDYRTS